MGTLHFGQGTSEEMFFDARCNINISSLVTLLLQVTHIPREEVHNPSPKYLEAAGFIDQARCSCDIFPLESVRVKLKLNHLDRDQVAQPMPRNQRGAPRDPGHCQNSPGCSGLQQQVSLCEAFSAWTVFATCPTMNNDCKAVSASELIE